MTFQILSIPVSAAITSNTATRNGTEISHFLLHTLMESRSNDGHSVVELISELAKLEKLHIALFILHLRLNLDRGAEHIPYAPYIKMLPGQYNIPVWWTNEELKLGRKILGSKFDEHLSKYYMLVAFLEPLLTNAPANVFPPPRLFNNSYKKAIRWAWSVVQTRSWDTQPGPNSTVIDGSSLLPLVDMLNHHPDAKRAGGFRQKEQHDYVENGGDSTDSVRMEVRAHRDYVAGEPVHDNYGSSCANNYLEAWGFVHAASVHTVCLSLSIAVAAPSADTLKVQAQGSAAEKANLSEVEAVRLLRHRALSHLGIGTRMTTEVRQDGKLSNRALLYIYIAGGNAGIVDQKRIHLWQAVLKGRLKVPADFPEESAQQGRQFARSSAMALQTKYAKESSLFPAAAMAADGASNAPHPATTTSSTAEAADTAADLEAAWTRTQAQYRALCSQPSTAATIISDDDDGPLVPPNTICALWLIRIGSWRASLRMLMDYS